MCGFEMHLALLLDLVRVMDGSSRGLCCLLLLLLLLRLLCCLLLSFWSAFLAGDVGQRSEDLTACHGDCRGKADWPM